MSFVLAKPCEAKTLSDQDLFFLSLVSIVQVHSPVLIGQRSQSLKVLPLNYYVSMSVAFFVAIFVCSLTCEPRAVYLRPGGRGGIHG